MDRTLQHQPRPQTAISPSLAPALVFWQGKRPGDALDADVPPVYLGRPPFPPALRQRQTDANGKRTTATSQHVRDHPRRLLVYNSLKRDILTRLGKKPMKPEKDPSSDKNKTRSCSMNNNNCSRLTVE